MTPKFKHDCDRCVLFYVDKHGDWYSCSSHYSPVERTIVLRAGDEGSLYCSVCMGEARPVDRLIMGALARGLFLPPLEKDRLLRAFLNHDLDRRPQKEFCFILPEELDKPLW